MIPPRKRGLDSDSPAGASKRPRIVSDSASSRVDMPAERSSNPEPSESSEAPGTKGKEKATETPAQSGGSEPMKRRKRINKLVPPRPWPTVAPSVSATGPRSAHKEGKNFICLTRKTKLGMYMRRCKDIILKDGYKTLHLSAMGAAIPLLLQLSSALPPILPFSRDEINTEVTTGTIEAHDEVIPEDEDEDISYQTRSKSTLLIIIRIGNGEFEGDRTGPVKRGNSGGRNNACAGDNQKQGKGKQKEGTPTALVYEEPEQEMMDML